ncbi:Rieske (2Fe-2S) protein [Pseudorhodoplanes sinuspersici]|uniref:Ferredoxin n=1 Tax=Pseudorhodoplanes sinuspersici TaxID=1235591 RepID=A0A1W6ZKN7_9HYPH|nr:Rieske (2Fe-2S) protein [Pseudorhodoplanes sinuspersici]ARP97700.1 ferredoxin [Pseudorhodoplanes sinuspersici]RKE68582.1 3-phenylpropionate/trans-cinnamate dioxygenase ferredoxin subunit [Pseudorhodoplanes sinuspersici]
MPAHWVHACRLEAFENRQIIGVTVEGQHLVIVRDDDRFFAAERACPHEGADLAQGRCSGAKLHCPRHLAWFDLDSGAVSPGWSFRALQIYPVRVVGSDVWIGLARASVKDRQ